MGSPNPVRFFRAPPNNHFFVFVRSIPVGEVFWRLNLAPTGKNLPTKLHMSTLNNTSHYSHQCSELERVAPKNRSAKDHIEVANWFRVHCSKFVYSLSNDPLRRDHFLHSISRQARLFIAEPGQLICIQNETCDNLFIVYSGSVDIHFNSTGRVRGRQVSE